jgi:hypothetical protein
VLRMVCRVACRREASTRRGRFYRPRSSRAAVPAGVSIVHVDPTSERSWTLLRLFTNTPPTTPYQTHSRDAFGAEDSSSTPSVCDRISCAAPRRQSSSPLCLGARLAPQAGRSHPWLHPTEDQACARAGVVGPDVPTRQDRRRLPARGKRRREQCLQHRFQDEPA